MNLFVYGTLRDRELMALVAGPGDGVAVAGTLADHRVLRQAAHALPVLCSANGFSAEGDVWQGLSAAQIARLDAYETPFHYALRSVTVETDLGPVACHAYFPGADVQASDVAFDMAEWCDTLRPITMAMATEISRTDPPMDGQTLARAWPMIEKRATAHLRAVAEPTPATVRRGDGVAQMPTPPTLRGSFFRLAECRVQHSTFDGQITPVLPREVLIGSDAALVLPYDTVRDRVLLVEQFRMPAYLHGNRNPWMLEPIAGMIDAGETAAEAALRESAEEAGLTGLRLEHMFGFYTSPGNATDHFTCFLGLADLPHDAPYMGGLAEEVEDLRLHTLGFDQAMELIDSGEIVVGPLITMLYWLDRNRARLRAAA